ncbi:MAG: type I CRISPR-associated protein Cas8a1/Csx8 [Lachnospiraceae bacterium]|nr:type I CRISPR-associated protein Cas8a1/Csx8 [Lachnospiraceae bacterium]
MKREWMELEAFDWRYSAAIVGLLQYFRWLGKKEPEFELTEEVLRFPAELINESDYLKFVEYKYPEDMHHLVIEEMVMLNQPSDEQVKLVNEKLAANTILKKVFKKVKYDGTNAEEILALLNENREEIIRETYRNKVNLYRNYCNTNQLFEGSKDCCRLLGYYVDMPKKGKALSYNFNISNFVARDEQIFDFIPFAFYGERDFFFINDNTNLKLLEKTNSHFDFKIQEEKKAARDIGKAVDARQIFFEVLIGAESFIKSDVEIITKNVERTHFETLFLRDSSLKILRSLAEKAGEKSIYQCFCFKVKITDNYWLDIFKKVTDAIVNMVLLDDLINYLLRHNQDNSYTYVISQLIRLNVRIKEEKEMDKGMKTAYACAKRVVQKRDKVPDNKLEAYNKKLTSALTLEDYDRFCQILLNLANYAEESFDFAYDLFEDFERNKELAYTFVNALRRA